MCSLFVNQVIIFGGIKGLMLLITSPFIDRGNCKFTNHQTAWLDSVCERSSQRGTVLGTDCKSPQTLHLNWSMAFLSHSVLCSSILCIWNALLPPPTPPPPVHPFSFLRLVHMVSVTSTFAILMPTKLLKSFLLDKLVFPMPYKLKAHKATEAFPISAPLEPDTIPDVQTLACEYSLSESKDPVELPPRLVIHFNPTNQEPWWVATLACCGDPRSRIFRVSMDLVIK